MALEQGGGYQDFTKVTHRNNTTMSISAWIKSTNPTAPSNFRTIVGDRASANAGYVLYWGGSNIVRASFRSTSASATVSTTALTTNTWTHVCVTYNAGNSEIWKDGVSEATSAVMDTTLSLTGNPAIHCREWDGANVMDGTDVDVREIAVFDWELADDEVGALAAGLSPLVVAPGKVVNYWPLINGSADLMTGSQGSSVGTVAFNTAEAPVTTYPSTYKVQTYPPLQAAVDIAPRFYHHRHHNMAA